jgi:hypothetical protein
VAAADEPGGGVQDAVAQGLGFGFGEVAVEGEYRSQASRVAASSAAASHAWLRVNEWLGKWPSRCLAGAHAVFDAGVHAVGGVDVGYLAAPAASAFGQVGGS